MENTENKNQELQEFESKMTDKMETLCKSVDEIKCTLYEVQELIKRQSSTLNGFYDALHCMVHDFIDEHDHIMEKSTYTLKDTMEKYDACYFE